MTVGQILTRFLFPIIILSLLTRSSPAVAQQKDVTGTGVVTGRIVDKGSGQPLASANVTIPGTGIGTVTDSLGEFFIPGISPGEYRVRAVLLGYAPRMIPDVIVSSARPAILLIELEESAFVLGEVQADAGYFSDSPEFPVSTLSQSSEEIRRLPGGFEDVLRAVAILPGVASAEAGRNDIIARGGAPSENLYLVDGIEIPNINHFGTQGSGGGPLSFINLDFVRSTEFSAGGFGVPYGQRISSVLQINLREGRRDRFGGKLTLSATQFGVNLEGPTGNDGSLLLSARRSYLDFIFRAAGFGFVPEYWDFTAKWNQRLGTSDELSILGIAALDGVNFFNETPDQIYDNARILGSDQEQFSGGVVWRHLFSSGFTRFTSGQSYTRFRYTQRDTLQNPIFSSASIEHESYLRGDIFLSLSTSIELSFGLQGKRTRLAGDIRLIDFVTPFGDTLGLDTRYDAATMSYGGYLQLSGRYGPLTLTGGIRITYDDLIGASSTVDPRLALTVRVSPVFSLSASGGRYSQPPAYLWLITNPANGNLGFITAHQYIVGADYSPRPDTRVRVELYRKQYGGYPASLEQEFLVLSNTGAGFGGSEQSFSSFGIDPLVSTGTGFSQGVELSLTKKLSVIPCYGIVAVSLSRTLFRARDGIERPSSFDQSVILNIGGGYLLDEHWEISARFRLATGRPFTPFLADGTKDVGAFNAERLPVGHSLDLRTDRRWFFRDWTLIVYIDVQNIYNNKPARPPRFDERTGRIEADDAIGILPSIGISAEF